MIDFQTIDQVVARAAAVLDPGVHTWAAAGAGQEITKTRNTLALSSLALIPRIGRDVGSIDTSTSLAGVPLSIPVVMAPIGALGLYDPDDALAAARAAARTSTSAFCSILTTSPWEEVSATAPGRHFFQIYVFGDRDWLARLLDVVETMGFAGLCVTMDASAIGRRDRSLESGFTWHTPPQGTPNLAPMGWEASHRARFTWADLAWLCSRTDLPMMVKGVMNVEDALTAVDCGAGSVYVSNHGGRMVDHGLSTIEVLGEIVAAVPDEIEVIVDSGFTRGAEVCKAIALGARAVGIGRLQCWGLAAGGAGGLARVVEILRDEISVTMANLGCSAISEIGPDRVRWSLPVSPPPTSPA